MDRLLLGPVAPIILKWLRSVQRGDRIKRIDKPSFRRIGRTACRTTLSTHWRQLTLTPVTYFYFFGSLLLPSELDAPLGGWLEVVIDYQRESAAELFLTLP